MGQKFITNKTQSAILARVITAIFCGAQWRPISGQRGRNFGGRSSLFIPGAARSRINQTDRWRGAEGPSGGRAVAGTETMRPFFSFFEGGEGQGGSFS